MARCGWQNSTLTEQINRFLILAQCGRFCVTALGDQFSISRKTGNKHMERYVAHRVARLGPQRHRSYHSPQLTDSALTALLLADRRLNRRWVDRIGQATGIGPPDPHGPQRSGRHTSRQLSVASSSDLSRYLLPPPLTLRPVESCPVDGCLRGAVARADTAIQKQLLFRFMPPTSD